ncbi:MAG: 2Fe-2S iron-sulfur cluster-binding protein [Planctomycetota bacterium]
MIIEVLIAVAVVSSIGTVLAALLTLCEHFLANYGPCKIDINDERDITVQGGKDLLGMLTAEKIFIPSACGGRGTCGLCKLKVLEGGGPLLPTEEPFLEAEERVEYTAFMPGQDPQRSEDRDSVRAFRHPRICLQMRRDSRPYSRHKAVPFRACRARDD